MDFNQLLKLAEQKKSEPIDIGKRKEVVAEMEPGAERPMTKKQKREYEEEMARRQRRQERLDAEKGGGGVKKGKGLEFNRDGSYLFYKVSFDFIKSIQIILVCVFQFQEMIDNKGT